MSATSCLLLAAGSFQWPSGEEFRRVVALQDYNTRIVVLGTMLLGISAGLIGSFLLLRKRALIGDALSHATLPGIGLAFILASFAGGNAKSLAVLLAGAAISGAIGVGCVLLIRRFTRLKEDAALGIVLSVFFGLGVAILGVIQKMDTGSAAGLESFIYGKTASMLRADAILIGMAAVLTAAASLTLFKEFSLLCFDQDFAGAQGWPVLGLDALMMTLVVLVTVIGLQAVGLILMVALLVIPPAAARFWTHHLPTMLAISAAIGGVSGFIGAAASALLPRLPAGAIIVVVASAAFAFSLVFGSVRGLVVAGWRRSGVRAIVMRHHLLRALFEHCESRVAPMTTLVPVVPVSLHELLRKRSWSPASLRRCLRRLIRDGLVHQFSPDSFALTDPGRVEARRVVRNHRLWELFLITHADVAPSHVDRGADELEHVLAPDVMEKLEAMLAADGAEELPPSPHVLTG